MTASASFTFATDNVENPLSEPFEPGKRWTCWSSGRREDWYAIDFGVPRTLTGLTLYFFDDAPNGECRPPASFQVEIEAYRGIAGVRCPADRGLAPPAAPGGENEIRFEPVRTSRFRIVFRHAGERFYTGLYGLKPIGPEGSDAPVPPSPLRFTADKFITADDIAGLASSGSTTRRTRCKRSTSTPIDPAEDHLRLRAGRQRLGTDRTAGRRDLRVVSRGPSTLDGSAGIARRSGRLAVPLRGGGRSPAAA